MGFENSYKRSLDILEGALANDTEKLHEFDVYKDSLLRHLEKHRTLGGHDSAINRDVDNLTRLSRIVTGKSFRDLSAETGVKGDLNDPANFDLEEFDDCLELLLNRGLIGISVTIAMESSRYFPKYLQKRLQVRLENLSRGEIYEAPPVSLKASLVSLDALVKELSSYKLRLNTTDIMLTVRAEDEDRLALFWEKLTHEFCNSFDCRFLVLIIKESEFSSPPSIEHNFPPPDFKSRHVYKWIDSLAGALETDVATKEKLIRDWFETINQSCTQNRKFYTDRVYEHIESSLGLLKKPHPSLDELYQFFEDWKQLYAQTPS